MIFKYGHLQQSLFKRVQLSIHANSSKELNNISISTKLSKSSTPVHSI